MAFEEEPLDDEVEEIRELIYEILKEFPTGITSNFLEEKYTERYVQKGMAKELPRNWLSLMRTTEEFELKDVSTFTMLYLVQTTKPNSLFSTPIQSDRTMEKSLIESTTNNNSTRANQKSEKPEGTEPIAPSIIVRFKADEFEPIPLSGLPQPNGDCMPVRLISATDPDCVYFRLADWVPYCEYLYAALSRLPPTNNLEPEIGEILAAEINERWKRVEIIRLSAANPHFWVVSVVDEGYYHAVHRTQLRLLTETVTAFNKIFLAKCKLEIDRVPPSDEKEAGGQNRNWSAEMQHFISESLQKLAMRSNCRTELQMSRKWEYVEGGKMPMCTAKLLIDGTDFSKLMGIDHQ